MSKVEPSKKYLEEPKQKIELITPVTDPIWKPECVKIQEFMWHKEGLYDKTPDNPHGLMPKK